MSALITAAELETERQNKNCELILLDVRWVLGRNDGAQQYAAGHIPGAVFVDLETELSAPASKHSGRHPLPSPADFERSAHRWGINQDSTVVIYDDSGALAAARAWWLLRHAGFEQVRVLDGGLEAWRTAQGELTTGEQSNPPGRVALSWGRMPVLEREELATFTGVLLDSRATARYLGIEEPIDPVAGHIPGALNRPTTSNLDSQARFLPASTLRTQFAALGADGSNLAAYCGSGVTAAHQVLAAEQAGFLAALYPGSWSQYCSYPDAPVATIDEQHRH